ncbi:MAG: radical SAM protein [Malacoplasma sp.]|nr:radical SAM protein [Malacoplasma sp.]
MNSQIKFNVAYIKLFTKTEGPFDRCCIWFQGCNLNCKGCCNKDLQPFTPNHIVSLEKLVSIVKDAATKFNIEGVTLCGGEPSFQKGLVEFNNEIHKLGLGIIMFSGRLKNQLDPKLVNSVDLLIDGPFIESLLDTKRVLLGSKNKKLNFITDRYKSQADYFNNPVSIEEVTAEDYIFINGD